MTYEFAVELAIEWCEANDYIFENLTGYSDTELEIEFTYNGNELCTIVYL